MPIETRPNLFIVGAQKSGTSALAGWLGQHPQVCMSFPKEPGYLAFGERGYPFPDGYGKPAPASGYVVRDERAYLNLFAHATPDQHIRGEASTWYFALPGMAHSTISRWGICSLLLSPTRANHPTCSAVTIQRRMNCPRR